MAFSISFADEQSWYEENYEVEDAGEIETEDLEYCEYKSMRSTFDLFEKLKKENEALKAENKSQELTQLLTLKTVNDLKAEVEDLETQIMEYETTERSDIEDLEEMTQEKAELEEKVEELKEEADDKINDLKAKVEELEGWKNAVALLRQCLQSWGVEIEELKAENIAMWDAISSHKCEESDIGDFELKKDKDGIPLHPFTAIRNELNAEIEKLKTKNESVEDFWTCIMDHICCDSKPDNPDELWVEGWCERKGIDGDKKKNLYEEFEFYEE